MKWSIEEKEEMFQLLAQGLSMREVGKVLGRSKNGVIAQYNKSKPIDHKPLHTVPARWTPEDHKQASEWWMSGASYSFIGSRLNRSPGAVVSYAKEHRQDFPERQRVDVSLSVKSYWGNLKTEKPTPENTIIQYEYKEVAVPENAHLVSYLELKPHKCKWICDSFWEEFDIDRSKCCGLNVHDKEGSAMQRNYCSLHYKASIRTV